VSSGRDESILFSPAAIAVLREARFNPNAKRQYEIMSGGFVWSDERLFDSVHSGAILPVRFLMAYRSSLTLGTPDEEARVPWDKLLRECPEWPGFSSERRDPSLAKELDAECRRVRREIIALDRDFRKKQRQRAQRRPWWRRIFAPFRRYWGEAAGQTKEP